MRTRRVIEQSTFEKLKELTGFDFWLLSDVNIEYFGYNLTVDLYRHDDVTMVKYEKSYTFYHTHYGMPDLKDRTYSMSTALDIFLSKSLPLKTNRTSGKLAIKRQVGSLKKNYIV